MKKGLVEIIVILDRSGSMDSLVAEAITGYNRFIEENKKVPGEAKVTLILFDTQYEVVYDGKPLQDVPVLTEEVFTALLYALGRTIDDVGKRFANIQEADRPEKVLVYINTDGLENASQYREDGAKYTQTKVREMVHTNQRSEKYKWVFEFAGAGIDAFTASACLGIAATRTFQSSATIRGINATPEHMTQSAIKYRTSSLDKIP